jgi:RNA polymerase sigma-70 factor (ECF subfamily)
VRTDIALAAVPVGAAANAAVGDERLARQAQLGDATAFEALYRAHVGRIHALCLRLAGSRPAAEDLTQEVFVRAWRKLASFRGDAAFGTWLYRLALNVVVSELRSGRAPANAALTDDPAALERLSSSPRPDVALDLERAIAALPAGARMVFVLHDVVGWRHEEIARALEIAVGTARVHLHHARARLREVLK